MNEKMQVAKDETVTDEAFAAIRSLSSSRTVARSALWNLIGRAGPMVVAVIITPLLVRDLGPSRWGVFTIALSLVGIFSIFDFGVGRALTRTIAELMTENKAMEAATLARSGLTVLTVLGTAGGLIMAALANRWVNGGLHIAPELHREVLDSLYVLCFSAPIVILCSALWGVIGAFQEFRAANLVNVPIMAMYYIGPLLVLRFFNSLVAVIAVLVLCRVVTTIAFWRICLRALPELKQARTNMKALKPVLRMGGWMTASNITFPILTYVDRFIIASVLSAAATGYYSTPFDLVMRFTIVPVAIMSTAYPAMAASYRTDPANTQALFRRSLVSVMGALFPACLLSGALSHWILTLWLGASFAGHAAVVLRWLGVGILLSSVDSVVGGLLDGIGRPSINAKFSLIELVLYLPILTVLVRSFGLKGAAIGWAVRCLFDLTLRLWIAQRIYEPLRPTARSLLPLLFGATLSLFLAAITSGTRMLPVVAVAGALLVFGLLWRSLTDMERRQFWTFAGRYLKTAG